MPKAIIIRKTGGPSVLKLEEVAEPKAPGPGQLLIKHTVIGVNYLDVYYRTGVFKSKLPIIPGMEASGVVEAAGPDTTIPVGTRVVYGTITTGSYCESRLIKEKYVIALPDAVPDEIAAASFTRLLTAHYLLLRTYKIRKGDTILIHAAAGGVGQILCQLAKLLGATVIGTVGNQEKANVARSCGCDHVIVYTEQDFVEEVKKFTNNMGVIAVYDSVGKDTFKKSLECLMPMGLMVSFGQSSGPVPPINVLSLAKNGVYLTRPTVMLYKSERKELVLTAVEIFRLLVEERIKINIANKFPLADAAKAHSAIESRDTIGPNVLIV